MAGVTGGAGGTVPVILSFGDRTIVTTGTATGQCLVMIHIDTAPGTRLMTGTTYRRSQWVISRTIVAVTCLTSPDNLVVIHLQYRHPDIKGLMAGLTNISTVDMPTRETVALDADAQHLIMIDLDNLPISGQMTGFADIAGLRVVIGPILIMTGRTRAQHLIVINRNCRNPRAWQMTSLAYFRGIYVVINLTRCCGPIVTGRAGLANHCRMIKRRGPGQRRVTIFARGSGLNMTGPLTLRSYAIVTSGASAEYLIVIHQ